jgi:hypothetical protein
VISELFFLEYVGAMKNKKGTCIKSKKKKNKTIKILTSKGRNNKEEVMEITQRGEYADMDPPPGVTGYKLYCERFRDHRECGKPFEFQKEKQN